ncbi:MAG: TIGR00270 family protein [Promethearchaeota archaeon]|nr:MAG: TIGR00270 family protein [Candidatus Lokiarchaeota archaeon]
MYGKKSSKLDDECPICGGKIWKGQKVLIEGAKIRVCQNCAIHGKKISPRKKATYNKIAFQTPLKKSKSFPKYRSKELLEPSLELVPEFAKSIRNARTAENLTQEEFAKKLNEKPSLMRRVESGFKPTIDLAQKIEKTFNIKLLRKVDDVEVNTKNYMKKSKGTSLGDIAFIKKKK